MCFLEVRGEIFKSPFHWDVLKICHKLSPEFVSKIAHALRTLITKPLSSNDLNGA